MFQEPPAGAFGTMRTTLRLQPEVKKYEFKNAAVCQLQYCKILQRITAEVHYRCPTPTFIIIIIIIIIFILLQISLIKCPIWIPYGNQHETTRNREIRGFYWILITSLRNLASTPLNPRGSYKILKGI